MAQCDLCGRDAPLFNTLIEGTTMKACGNCASFGKKLTPAMPAGAQAASKKSSKPQVREEVVIEVVEDAAARIRAVRERSGLTQAQFASRIGERESVIPKIESGSLRPSLKVARKIEREFDVSLTEKVVDQVVIPKSGPSATFTLGDFVKIKKRGK